MCSERRMVRFWFQIYLSSLVVKVVNALQSDDSFWSNSIWFYKWTLHKTAPKPQQFHSIKQKIRHSIRWCQRFRSLLHVNCNRADRNIVSIVQHLEFHALESWTNWKKANTSSNWRMHQRRKYSPFSKNNTYLTLKISLYGENLGADCHGLFWSRYLISTKAHFSCSKNVSFTPLYPVTNSIWNAYKPFRSKLTPWDMFIKCGASFGGATFVS